MIIDDLAAATQREFQGVRDEMSEFKNEILRAIDRVDTHLSAFASQANEDIINLQESVREHDGRLGVAKATRAEAAGQQAGTPYL